MVRVVEVIGLVGVIEVVGVVEVIGVALGWHSPGLTAPIKYP